MGYTDVGVAVAGGVLGYSNVGVVRGGVVEPLLQLVEPVHLLHQQLTLGLHQGTDRQLRLPDSHQLRPDGKGVNWFW